MTITVRVPGSCGELLQGQIDETLFLVTCPIDQYATATVHLNESQARYPIGDKVRRAIRLTCEYLAVDMPDFALSVTGDLPYGKGMASSSADILASCHAVALAYGRRLTEEEAFRLALLIEPTDATACEGVVLADHISGKRFERLGRPPKMRIAVFDYGGTIDTVAFNARRDLTILNRKKQARIAEALCYIRKGFLTGDPAFIGKGATISALANQAILYKRSLTDIIQIAKEEGAVGVNVAHSGTVLGVLFDARCCERYEQCIQRVERAVDGLHFYTNANLVSGGVLIGGDSDE